MNLIGLTLKLKLNVIYTKLLGNIPITCKFVTINTNDGKSVTTTTAILENLSKYFKNIVSYNQEQITLDYSMDIITKMIKILHNYEIDQVEISHDDFNDLMELANYIDSPYLSIFLFFVYITENKGFYDCDNINLEQELKNICTFFQNFSMFDISNELDIMMVMWNYIFRLTNSQLDRLIRCAIADEKLGKKFLSFNADGNKYFDIEFFVKINESHSAYNLYWHRDNHAYNLLSFYFFTFTGINNNVYDNSLYVKNLDKIVQIIQPLDRNEFNILCNTLSYYENYFANFIYYIILCFSKLQHKNVLLDHLLNNYYINSTFYLPRSFGDSRYQILVKYFTEPIHTTPLILTPKELNYIYNKTHGIPNLELEKKGSKFWEYYLKNYC